MRELSDIRLDINRVDHEIQKLFLDRMALAEQVADYKIATGDKVLKPDREQALLEMMARTGSGRLTAGIYLHAQGYHPRQPHASI